MSKVIFAYARKNKKEDNIKNQIELINNYCSEHNLEIEERNFIVDGTDNSIDRAGYNALINYMMRSGDTLIISELDRLGKDISVINDEWIRLYEKGIDIIIINNPLMTTWNVEDDEKEKKYNLIKEILTYLSDKEKAKNKSKQAEGIRALKDKNNGKGVGRPKTKINKEFKDQYKLWKSNKQTAVETFKKLGLTKATFYRLVKEYELEKE